MKQHCHLSMVWFTWLGIPLIGLVAGLVQNVYAAAFVIIIGIIGELLYLRWFPRLSHWLGYGSVADVPADPAPDTVVPEVILYSANVCPFCPLVRRRLKALQENMKFSLREIDITFKPGLAREKGFRTVPVVEAGGRYWFGNATTRNLVDFLTTSNDSA
ncbi:MAG: glutaredoxin family protein [Fidelibacterota bacterium]